MVRVPRRAAQRLLAAALAIASLQAGAQAPEEEPLSTDRPDFIESSDVVGRGRFQIETSVASERGKNGQQRERLTSTPTLLRIGLSDTWEARIETDGALRLRSSDLPTGETTRIRGHGDVSLGLKWHSHDGDEATGRPSIGWLMHFDTPSGSRDFKGQGLRPSLRMVAEWELADGYGVATMPGVFVERDETGSRYVGLIASGLVSKAFTDRFRSFIEWSGHQLAARRHGGTAATS